MVTTSRVVYFAVAFCFALPIMALMFRDDDGDRGSMVTAVVFAAVMAIVVALFFGKGKR
jgi:hypothetical protein